MTRRLDFLTLEVGSTMTKANGFVRTAEGVLAQVAQGFAPTTVLAGDVSIGVEGAIRALETSSEYRADAAEVFINSSAAGGLKMSVHGLTLNMTARAAKEASLGAGGIIHKLTAGAIQDYDIEEIVELKPNLVLLAGGVDFGESETTLANARRLFSLDLNVPIIYAGNSALQRPIKKLAEQYGRELWMAENVFPAVDILNVAPLRTLIHQAFAKHIIHAPGMQKLCKYTYAPVLPTPGAVLLATQLFADAAGDTLVLDVGGATTDVHSVTDGSTDFAKHLLDPEPREKRTVEGDLGVFVNAERVLALDVDGRWRAKHELIRAMPQTDQERELTRWLCETAVHHAIRRHAGTITHLFTPGGKKEVVRGKDLTAIRWIIGTGGALTRVPGGEEILSSIRTGATTHLLPPPEARILLDCNYLLSALGTIAERHPKLVSKTLTSIFPVDIVAATSK
jgi:uncharacterized protein (TIGR01319 family)